MPPSSTPHPARAAAGAFLFVLALCALPAAVGFLRPPRGASWTGLVRRNTADVSVYLAHIEEIRRSGGALARNLHTAEPHPPFLLRPVYVLLGRVGALAPAVSSLALLEIGRLAADAALLAVLFLCARRILPERDRTAGFLVLALSSGLGWTGLRDASPDLTSPEVSTFLTLLAPPHFPLSLALLLAILLSLDRAFSAPSARAAALPALAAGAAGLWLGLEHPFDLFPLSAAVFGALLVLLVRGAAPPLRSLLACAPLAAGAAAAVHLQAAALRDVPVFAEWNRQNVVPTPAPAALIFAFGLLLPFAILGMHPLLAASRPLATLVLVYIGASLSCAYLPVAFQERFLEGLPACLGLLAACGVSSLAGTLASERARRLFLAGCVAALSPSSFVALGADLAALVRAEPPQMLPDRFLEGLDAAAQAGSPGDAFLCSEFTGNLLPGRAARPVVLGHRIQTARVEEKRALVDRFLGSSPDSPEAAALARASGARYLVWGPDEVARSAGRFDPSRAPFLERVFDNGAVSIWRIRDAP